MGAAWKLAWVLLSRLQLAHAHGHLCKAVVKRAAAVTAEVCAVSWGCGGCSDGSSGLRFRRAISNIDLMGGNLPECAPCGIVQPQGFPLDPLPEVAGGPPRLCFANGAAVECKSVTPPGIDHTTGGASHTPLPSALPTSDAWRVGDVWCSRHALGPA